MYSVVEIAGFQYKVRPGDMLDVQKLDIEAGKDTTFTKVFFIGGENTIVGKPTISGAQVVARVLKHDKADKIRILKRRPGRYAKRKGHRQQFTALLITEVTDGQGKAKKIEASHKLAEKYLK